MEKFKVIASGQTKDGLFWHMISKMNDGFECKAFIRALKLTEKGKDLPIPTNLVKTINWTL